MTMIHFKAIWRPTLLWWLAGHLFYIQFNWNGKLLIHFRMIFVCWYLSNGLDKLLPVKIVHFMSINWHYGFALLISRSFVIMKWACVCKPKIKYRKFKWKKTVCHVLTSNVPNGKYAVWYRSFDWNLMTLPTMGVWNIEMRWNPQKPQSNLTQACTKSMSHAINDKRWFSITKCRWKRSATSGNVQIGNEISTFPHR